MSVSAITHLACTILAKRNQIWMLAVCLSGGSMGRREGAEHSSVDQFAAYHPVGGRNKVEASRNAPAH